MLKGTVLILDESGLSGKWARMVGLGCNGRYAFAYRFKDKYDMMYGYVMQEVRENV